MCLSCIGDMLQCSPFEYTAVRHTLADQPWEVDRGVDADGGELLCVVDTWQELIARQILELFGLVSKDCPSSNGVICAIMASVAYVWNKVLEPWVGRRQLRRPLTGSSVLILEAIVNGNIYAETSETNNHGSDSWVVRHTLEVNPRFWVILRQIPQWWPGSPFILGMVASLLSKTILVRHNASGGQVSRGTYGM